MNRIVLAIALALLTACQEPQLSSNTEAYFAAHGIVPGQVNELRIGGTLFRFPAGVGLNPYTYQETYRSKDGSPMTLSTKEGMDQGKYEKVATPIVKGRADKVTFYLDAARDFAPGPDPFPSGQAFRVEISKWSGFQNNDAHAFDKYVQGRVVIDHRDLGLKEYVPEKKNRGTTYESMRPDITRPDGGRLSFECQQQDSTGLCQTGYVNTKDGFIVSIYIDKTLFLERWQGAYPAVVSFVDSVVAK